MTSRILVIPPSFFSPRVMEAVPAGRVFVSQLRRSFSVDVFDWPWSRQRPTAAPPWPSPGLPSQGVEATAAVIDPICHVIALGGGAQPR